MALVLIKASDIPLPTQPEMQLAERNYRRGYWDGVLAACNLIDNGSTQHNVRLWLFRELKEWVAKSRSEDASFEYPPECPLGRSEQEATIAPTACMPRAESGCSFVYAIGDGHGRVKIGTADDVRKRIKQLQTGNPNRLYLIAYLRLRRRFDADQIERAAHDENDRDRICGEWFLMSDACAVQALLDASESCGLSVQPIEVEDRVY
jgi:hypothetical protein